MTIDELKAKIEILVALNAQLAKRLADAGRPSREDHWERKAREHLAEVHALRAKCKRLETEQGLHALRKEVASLNRQREADARTIAELRAALLHGRLGEFELQRVLGASDIESATSAADRVMAELRALRAELR